jgi:hypothetical protein
MYKPLGVDFFATYIYSAASQRRLGVSRSSNVRVRLVLNTGTPIAKDVWSNRCVASDGLSGKIQSGSKAQFALGIITILSI